MKGTSSIRGIPHLPFWARPFSINLKSQTWACSDTTEQKHHGYPDAQIAASAVVRPPNLVCGMRV